MTPAQLIRLECLKLCFPKDIASPDVKLVLERTKALEAYVIGDGQADKAPSQQPLTLPHNKAGQSTHHGQTRAR